MLSEREWEVAEGRQTVLTALWGLHPFPGEAISEHLLCTILKH